MDHVAENVAWMPIMSLSAPYTWSKRVRGATARGVIGLQTWNIQTWDLTS